MGDKQVETKITESEFDKINKLVDRGLYIDIEDFVRNAIKKQLGTIEIIELREIPRSQAKQEIREYIKEHGNADIDDIANDLKLELSEVLELIEEGGNEMSNEEINNLMEKFVESVEQRSGLKVKAYYETTNGDEVESVCSTTEFIKDFELDRMDENDFLHTMDEYIENNEICSIKELDSEFIHNLAQFFNTSDKMILNLMASTIASMTTDEEYEILDTIQEKIGKGMRVEMILNMKN